MKLSKKSRKKIIFAILGIVSVTGIIGASIWFSMPVAQRNLLLFMMTNGEKYDNYEEYQAIDRNEEGLVPTSFDSVAANSNEGDNNTNIVAITEMVKNEDSKMLKKGMIQSIGIDNYNGWHLIADEGAAGDSNPFGPSPLSYFTAGLAANLHTQILKAAEVKGVELDLVKVEAFNKFRWDDMISAEGAGFLDLSTTNIIIESSESEEVIQEIITIAFNSSAAREALINETTIEPSLVINGDNWENYRSTPGTCLTDESFDGEMKLSQITDVPKKPETLDLTPKEDEGMSLDFGAMSNMEFEIYAIAESGANSERPYLSKVTISTPTDETWEIYSDEFMDEDDIPVAPTSLEYFTAGNALCLTSQMTLVSAMMGLDFDEYRVEQQIDYRQEDIDSTDMASYADKVKSCILIESDESQERLETCFNKALSLCFAGEGLRNETEMNSTIYLNGNELI